MAVHILGIRHHGSGSARHLLQALAQLQPDCVLIEGPPDADPVIAQAKHPDMQTPIALLVYNAALPQQATFYPFAEFSPEWVALQYALAQQIKVRFMDLPLAWQYAQSQKNESDNNASTEQEQPTASEQTSSEKDKTTIEEIHNEQTAQESETKTLLAISNKIAELPLSPLDHLAKIAGYDNTDLWWEHHFEQSPIDLPHAYEAHFKAVDTAMYALRETFNDETHNDLHNQQREAYMRRIVREAVNEQYQTIVVICGAWHAPALQQYADAPCEKADNALLKKMPKPCHTHATWLPWTYSRLSLKSGYGAGIASPGWFEHLWRNPNDRYGHHWLSRVAQLMRSKKMDVSTAHVIEAARLAEALAAMRQLSRPSLLEMNEAVQSVIGNGDALLLQLIDKELIVSEKMGKVPDNLPKPPIQLDFEQKIKSLRLTLSEMEKELVLDLRNETDLWRSRLLFSLQILNIPWAKMAYSRSKGTFKEVWLLRWNPELIIRLIEMGLWGNTIQDATTQYLQHLSEQASTIKAISNLIAQAIPAALYRAIDHLKNRLDELAAIGSDIQDLLASLAPLLSITRYGDVRQTDANALLQVVEKIIERICIGLAIACYGLDEKSATEMYKHIRTAHEALSLLDNDNLKQSWFDTLHDIGNSPHVSPITAGCAVRLLFDSQQLSETETALRFDNALSISRDPSYTAAWLEGFLKNSSDLILYDNVLWHILHKWVCELSNENFMEQLPILRRTFAQFEPTQRRMIGEKAVQTLSGNMSTHNKGMGLDKSNAIKDTFNAQRAEQVLPILWQILGQ